MKNTFNAVAFPLSIIAIVISWNNIKHDTDLILSWVFFTVGIIVLFIEWNIVDWNK